MPTFVDPKARTEIDLGDGNRVWVKAKMDLRTQAAVERELIQMRINTADAGSQNVDILFSQTAQKLTLLKHNLVKWDGPMFVDNGRRVPCTPEMIEQLDLDECRVWIDLVADKIGELNRPKTADVATGEMTDPN